MGLQEIITERLSNNEQDGIIKEPIGISRECAESILIEAVGVSIPCTRLLEGQKQ